ncbi:MAG: hypothetical protein QGH51_02460 [Planctomycetota bacterium]|nr:hypothetical protein [Planctomycetota bacterium]
MQSTDPLLRLVSNGIKHERRGWEKVGIIHESFLSASGARRFQLLSQFFEEVIPWIENGIRTALLRHFLLVPIETIASRLFAQAARLKEFPKTPEAFSMWIEGKILEGMAETQNGFSLWEENSKQIQDAFNELPVSDRTLLFLTVVENCDSWEASKRTGLSVQRVEESLSRIQDTLQNKYPALLFPKEWECMQS